MGNLIVTIPLKQFDAEYQERLVACIETWLLSVTWRGFTDAELGLTGKEREVRQLRTKLMAEYAFNRGYDHMLRIDSDAYLHVGRFLASGFEKAAYTGHTFDQRPCRKRFAHGGSGFVLNRAAMAIIAKATPHATQPDKPDAEWFGDIWTGQVLWDAGISCNGDDRFIPDNGWDHRHETDWITLHPLTPAQIYEIHASRHVL
jgi:hypothetical protein